MGGGVNISKTYKEIAAKQDFDVRSFERFLLLNRFSFSDKQLYEFADTLASKDERLSVFVEKYRPDYEAHERRGYSFTLRYDDKRELIRELSRASDDEGLVRFFNYNAPGYDYTGLGKFRGRFYTYTMGGKLELRCEWDDVYQDTLKAIEETKERAKYFLWAIIRIYSIDKFEKYTYSYGPPLSEIQSVIKDMVGRTVRLAPQDYVILKAYRLYYKSGSKRYPGHSIPFEIISPVEKALEKFLKE